jgi:hypothetical protein
VRRRVAILAAAAILGAGAAPASAAPPAASLKLFSALKVKVDRQGYKILAGHLALADLEGRVDWNEACSPNVIDLGAMLDFYVAPLHPAGSWELLGGKGLYAIAWDAQCVDETPPTDKRATKETHPLDGLLLRKVRR